MSLPSVLGFCLLSLAIRAASAAAVNDSPLRRSPSCLPDQRAHLLQFKNSLWIANAPSYGCPNTSYPKTLSWREDCCSWDGVTCNAQTGIIVSLDLSCSLLVGTFDSNSSLFSLPTSGASASLGITCLACASRPRLATSLG
ncbi:hypothetical protein MLD38_000564 [Melastoma candidum]|uniref:Uncharacterized protein n=1 Tax=Melastoma candidum TaxID=119954 RepID=A0ACB9SA98_9MYRT|nr:hypothetical protein MLD38_000564 [Melastoma candidum]